MIDLEVYHRYLSLYMKENEREWKWQREREGEREGDKDRECLEIGFKTPPVKKFILTTNEFLRRLYN